MTNPTIIQGNVSGQHIYEGDTIIKGKVESDSNILVKNGGLKIEGNVGNDVAIAQVNNNPQSFSGGVSFGRGGSINITSASNVVINNGRIFVGGREINPNNQSQNGLNGIEITGDVATSAKIGSTESITIGGFLATQSQLKAKGSINCNDIWRGAVLEADGSINANDIREAAQLRAGGSINVNNIGKDVGLNAGGSIKAEDIESGARLNAGGSIKVERIAANASLNAGGSIKADAADPSARLNAGGSVKIDGQKQGGGRSW